MSAEEPRRGARGRRRFLVPEVIQTSGMDCGPAALKALLEGFHVPVSYGRLREACHTDVDGTSIDTIEEIAKQLGVDARQVVLPVDHVLLASPRSAPAIVVTRTPAGAAHFVLLWRTSGPYVQIMDPARGRLWVSRTAFVEQLFVHSMNVPAKAWREWAGTEPFLTPLTNRLRSAGIPASEIDRHLGTATSDESALGLAALDAATRMVASIKASGGFDRRTARSAIDSLVTAARNDSATIPDQYWSALPMPGAESVRLRGAVLIRADGLTTDPGSVQTASADLTAALREPPARPLHHVFQALRQDGLVGPAIALCAIGIAAAGVVLEALLLRSVLDVSTLLVRPEQALAAGLVLAAFAVALLGIEVALASAERRAGSHLEARLRMAFFEKIPRLADLYFQSRPISDMLERSHSLHGLRTLPPVAVRFLRVAAELAITTAAIAWLDPAIAGLAVVAAVAAAGIPLVANGGISNIDLKVRTHVGALTRFHLDALLGRTALEAHAAERTIEREHDRLLAEWVRAALALQRRSTMVEGIQMTIGFGIAAWLLFSHAGAATSGGTLLLMAYWVLNLPALGYELALTAREYPAHRSTLLRLLEPLGAPDSSTHALQSMEPSAPQAAPSTGIGLELRSVSVSVAGHQILQQIDLDLTPGTHVAIVGPSGAGKSTLIGLLLGWHRAEAGEVLIDGFTLSENMMPRLRASTAWVDPTIQLWNRSLLENLTFGASGNLESSTPVLEAAGLLPVLTKLQEGLATQLGENGALLSAGEGQRVRLGRAMVKQDARLVLLDEPFLGLERDRRRALLAQARQRWSGRTLLYVTHDVSETRAFDRVLVLDHGRIAEEGHPHQLAQMPSSRYRRLLQAQEAAYGRLTSGVEWRRLRLDGGRIVQDHGVSSLEQRA